MVLRVQRQAVDVAAVRAKVRWRAGGVAEAAVRLCGLLRMVAMAERLDVGRVQLCAAVADPDDMVDVPGALGAALDLAAGALAQDRPAEVFPGLGVVDPSQGALP